MTKAVGPHDRMSWDVMAARRTSKILEAVEEPDGLGEAGEEVVLDVQDEEVTEISDVGWEDCDLVVLEGEGLQFRERPKFQWKLGEHIVVEM